MGTGKMSAVVIALGWARINFQSRQWLAITGLHDHGAAEHDALPAVVERWCGGGFGESQRSLFTRIMDERRAKLGIIGPVGGDAYWARIGHSNIGTIAFLT